MAAALVDNNNDRFNLMRSTTCRYSYTCSYMLLMGWDDGMF
jgi:hypothetical protein